MEGKSRMAFMTWRADYSIGVAAIDREHRELVELVNEIDAKLNSPGCEEDRAENLRRFAAYARVHFQHEESTFVGTRYGRACLHARKHRHLLLILDSFQRMGRFVDLHEQPEFLRRWVIDHIVVEDKALGAYLNGVCPVASPPHLRRRTH